MGHIRYVVQINMKKGKPKYLSIAGNPRPNVIIERSKATTFDNHRVAEIVSSWFWDNYWNDEDFSTREVVVFRSRK